MIEVEKKFQLSGEEKQRLLTGAAFVSEKTFTDVYYDTKDYFTTKQDSESVGIGLSIVKHHMERLGGKIEVTETNNGAEFSLKFRKATPEAKAA